MSARRKWFLVGVTAVLLLGLVALALYARGGGDVPGLGWLRPAGSDPLAASGPEEVVLRTLRLAGYDHAAVGRDGSTAVVRIDLPSIASPADAELGWQTGFAALSVAYPSARTYGVQLLGDSGPLLEVSAEGDAVRSAVKADDAAALRRAASFRYLLEGGGGE